MASVPDHADRFRIDRVLSRAFSAIWRNLPLYVALSLLLVGLPRLLFGLLLPGTASFEALRIGAVSPGFFFSAGSVTLICTYLLQATLVRATIEDLGGRRPTFGDCLATGVNVLLPVIGITIVSTIGVVMGMILLIVPGFILLIAWSAAIPAEVEERRGVLASLARSRALTRGSRWQIFGLFIIMFVIIAIIQVTIVMLFAAFGATALVVGSAVAGAIVGTLFMTVGAALYVELRTVKEGASLEALASVFA